MSKNNLKSSQKQSVVVKIGDTTYKRRRPKRKVGIKKISPIINTGPFVTGILATPSSFPSSGSASTFQNISPFQPRNIIAADPRSPIQPIYQPEAYNSLFPGPGQLVLNARPSYLKQFDSDIQEVPSPYKNRSPSIYSITSDESSQWLPEDFRNIASQNISSGLSLETISIPQQGMGSNVSPVKMEDYGKASYQALSKPAPMDQALSGPAPMDQDIQNAMKGMSQSDYAYGGGGFSDDQIQAALTYNSLTPVKSEAESKIDFK